MDGGGEKPQNDLDQSTRKTIKEDVVCNTIDDLLARPSPTKELNVLAGAQEMSLIKAGNQVPPRRGASFTWVT